MPTVNPCPLSPKLQLELASGLPAVGNLLFFYVAGSVGTKQTTYTNSTGTVANTNPLVLNSLGQPTTEIWFTAGQSYKVVYAPSTDTDPPTSPIWSVDNLVGINDTINTADQWVSGPAPTFVSATSFTLAGDQTSIFQVGRRVKATVTAGTVYGTITVSTFAALTTVTVVNDSGALDSGLSAVSYGLLTTDNPSTPLAIDTYPIVSGSVDKTKKLRFEVDGQTTALTRVLTTQDQSFTLGSLARSYLAGCALSTAGSSATMSIAAGQCSNSTNVIMMALTAIAKTTAAWVVGTAAGGLDTGAIANSTWYHFYVIQRLDTSVVDVVFSTNATTPTLPANYTIFRRIGSGFTNGAAQWTLFVQDGDVFLWDTMVLNINTAVASATAASYTLTTPLGVKTVALLHGTFTFVTAAGRGCLLSSLDEADIAPVVNTGKVTYCNPVDSQYVAGDTQIRTNTSSQIRVRCTDNASNLNVNTYGWIDRRGRDA